MTQYTATEVATAFMQQNDKTSWEARAISRVTGDVCIFKSTTGMVSLMYTPHDGLFAVKFNKFQGAWGDYIGAIARTLFTVLTTLKSAGLAFEAPPTLAGMVIEATTTEEAAVYVRWPHQSPKLESGSMVDAVLETERNFGKCEECGENHDRRVSCPLPPVL